MKTTLLFILMLCGVFHIGFGQVTIFSETIGTGTGTQSIAATTFQNSGTLTYSGTADTRVTTGSTGYTGASGGKNVFFTNNSSSYFEISGINTSTYTNLALSFGHLKSTTAGNNELAVEVSSNGTLYTPLTYSRPTGTGTANAWLLLNATGTIPSTANLRIRFRQTSSTPQFRLDDIRLVGELLPTNTEVEFAAATYTVGENNASVAICANIVNPSSSVDTTVNVALTTSGSPHIMYATQTLTFPANSSAQQCVTIPITNNTTCGDTKNYTFTLQSIAGGTTATLGTQNSTVLTVSDEDGLNGAFKTLSFEGGDDLNYTGNGAVNTTANKYYGTQSYRLGGSNALTTANVSIAGITNVSLSVAFASEGADSGEDLFLEISYDNGGSWAGAGSVKLVDGFSNASLNIGSTNAVDPTTVPSNPYSVSIDPSETQIMVRVRAAGLDGGEYYYVDDIILSGNSCNTVCTPTHTVTNFAPTTGPVGTEVTITGSGFTASSIVRFNGIVATAVTFVNSTTLIADVASGTTTGVLSVEEAGCKLATSTFTIINTTGGCGNLSDLIMTEIYDQDGGSLGYIEVYNGTGSPINLTNYYIRRYGDAGELAANNYTDYHFSPSINSIADGQVLYGKISTDTDVASPNFSYSQTGFAGINGSDIFHLYRGNTLIDVYVVSTTDTGYTAKRRLTTTGPNLTSTPADWTITAANNVIGDLGLFPYVALSSFPTVTVPVDVTSCSATQAQFTAFGTPGASGTLTYRWYYNNGTALGWTQVTPAAFPLATVNGQTTDTFTLTGNFYSYLGYQFYCLVTESGSCSQASNAAQLKIGKTTWDGTIWTPSQPDINTIAIINGNYDTSIGGQQTGFSACQLIVNSNFELIIEDNTYVEVENNVTVNGNIIVRTKGSLVQNNNAGIVNGAVLTTPSKILVEKLTAPLNDWYEYTYWSSPVSGETIGTALSESNASRRFWFNAANFRDSTRETNNNNATISGQDDIDDNADDWTLAPANLVMAPGVGYTGTLSSVGFMGAGTQYKFTFEGPFNTGVINVPVLRNDAELADTDWNFIGNPYPSAISVNAFFTQNRYNAGSNPNGMLEGAIYLWSQNVAPSGSTNGNENLNFAQSDYATINGASQTAGGDMVMPNRYIPSGQGFFVAFSKTRPTTTGNAVFNNAMRMKDNTSNSQFFRTTTPDQNTAAQEANKLWVNLSSNNGVFNQISIAYVEGATDGYDGFYYDAPRNLSTDAHAILYSTIATATTLKFAIQGKQPSSLNADEVIPLGFYTSIGEPTTYTLTLSAVEGAFMNAQTIYVKDRLLGMVHNLTTSNYSFTSEMGEFNNRFEIVFRDDTLSIDGSELQPEELSIVELQDGRVKFTVPPHVNISSIELIDMLDRTLYHLQGNSPTEIYTLSQLSQAAYIARVRLSNGQTLTKRAIKRH